MSMLDKFGLGNFRLFKNTVDFELAPITLFTGVNNSGKSSVIKALRLIKDSINKTGDVSSLVFTEGNHNLGFFNQVINHDSQQNTLKFRFLFMLSLFDHDSILELEYIQDDFFKENGKLNCIRILVKDQEIIKCEFQSIKKSNNIVENNPVTFFRININLFKEIFKEAEIKAIADNDDMLLDYLENPSQDGEEYFQSLTTGMDAFKLLTKTILENNLFDIIRADDELISIEKDETLDVENLIIKALNEGFIANHYDQNKYDYSLLQKVIALLDQILIKTNKYGIYKYSASHTGKMFFNLITDGIKRSLDTFISSTRKIELLSSLRGNTARFYNNNSDIVDINNIILEYLSLDVKSNIDIQNFIKFALNLFEMGDSISITRHQGVASEIFLHDKDGTKKLLADMGFGYTQLLPVILKIAIIAKRYCNSPKTNGASISYEPSILILEEPESNLHPSYQSKLGDLFVEASKNFKIQFIIETHSEYFIRKLQYLTAKKIIKPDNAIIYYFNSKVSGNQKIVNKIKIETNGSLTDDFGPGFFDEADNLAIELYNVNSKTLN